jgi:tol-pal system protein YbgF
MFSLVSQLQLARAPMTRIVTGILALTVFSNLALFGAATAFGQSSTSDVVVRLDQLESQMRQLTGTVEQLQYRNQQLEQALQRIQGNQQLGSTGAPTMARPSTPAVASPPPYPGTMASVPPSQPVTGEALGGPAPHQPGAPLDLSTVASTGHRSDAFDPTQNPNAPGAPRPLGTLPNTGAPVGAGPSVVYQSPGGAEAGLPPPPPRNMNATGGQVAALPPSQSPRDEYDLAYGYLLRKDYALAEDSFRTFLRTYPTDPHAPDAQFWLGESLFQRQNYHDAADAFLTVSKKFEASSKAPDALLRLGQSLAAMGQKELACETFGEVGVKYPRATLNVRQSVEREQKRVHC